MHDPDWMWNASVSVAHREALDELIRAGRARPVPNKPRMYRAGAEAFLDGWLPSEPLIGPETRVVAIGSCFAALFAQWLADNGFNRHLDADTDEGLLRNSLESAIAVAQQFRWAFGELDPEVVVWFTPEAERFAASDERRSRLRALLESTEVLIVTLGLAEVWFDTATGEPIWRVPPASVAPGRYEMRVTGVDETVAAIETIDRLRREHMPNTKIVYTVSPVRFRVSFRPMNPLVANAASKAIVRASVDEFLRRHAREVGVTYFYFPSYELVKEFFVDAYSDNRHVHRHYSDRIIALFARAYTTLVAAEPPPFPASESAELRETVAQLEQQNEDLQRAADERLAVIEELKQVCDERLALVERLDAELAERAAGG